MSNTRRILNILLAVLMILGAFIMILLPDAGYLIIAGIMCIFLIVFGIREIIYYFTMTRHMVGGGDILFIGIIALDFGIFTGSLTSVPKVYIILYLVGTYAFAGLVDFLRVFEARKYQSPYWKYNMISGIIRLVIVITCVAFLFMRSTGPIVYIYASGLIYSALLRLVSAFRRTAIVYIQ